MRKRRENREGQYRSKAYLDLQQRIAGNLRQLRREYGWTQEDAAASCEMSVRLYQRVEGEGGNVTLTTMARLLEGFDIDPVDLVRKVK
jgi:transcriptional regulator with XRE-family HTH domain